MDKNEINSKSGSNGVEIERKFLLRALPAGLENYEKAEITQAYISTSPTIRIRKSGEAFYVTVKSRHIGSFTQKELEMEITEDEYSRLLPRIEKGSVPVVKTRFYIPLENGLTAELDRYYDALLGLYTVEVEFPSEDAAAAFAAPDWFGRDITADRAYSNSMLSIYGAPPKAT